MLLSITKAPGILDVLKRFGRAVPEYNALDDLVGVAYCGAELAVGRVTNEDLLLQDIERATINEVHHAVTGLDAAGHPSEPRRWSAKDVISSWNIIRGNALAIPRRIKALDLPDVGIVGDALTIILKRCIVPYDAVSPKPAEVDATIASCVDRLKEVLERARKGGLRE